MTGYSEGKGLFFARVTDGHLSNNYCTSEVEQQVALISYDEIMDGSLCYKLNGDQSTITWFQNLDNDAEVDDQPLPFSNGHAQVYPKGKMLCDGTVDPSGMTYSNNNEVIIPDHNFEDGFCTVCGQEDSNYTGFLAIIKNANFTNDSNFWTGNAIKTSPTSRTVSINSVCKASAVLPLLTARLTTNSRKTCCAIPTTMQKVQASVRLAALSTSPPTARMPR